MKLSDKVFQTLRDRIIKLEYPPETRLSEEALCHEFNVSRTPLREALQQLAAMNLIQIIPRYGTIIKPININEVRNAYEVKVHLESLAGSLAAQRITPDQLEKLKTILDDYYLAAKQGDITTGKDIQFHETIYEATQNEVLESSLKNLTSRCIRVCRLLIPQHLGKEPDVATLPEIYEALAAGDSELSGKLCQQHSQHYLDLLRASAI
ncbi:MAG: GntR family transcriptional regulator [Deltaproteobacteria bacterium]|nr:GntR family transcriptional regulator [Deltaproteobacteria bacterium]